MNARTRCQRQRQRGVAAIEFALVFMLGILPLIMLTMTGVLIFAAKESLTLAASEGARAALHYGNATQRQTFACQAAQQSMQWLLNFTGESVDCSAPQSPGGSYTPIAVSTTSPCPSNAAVQCMTVVTSFDYDKHPFIPVASSVYGWVMKSNMTSSATVQLDMAGG
ncbi:pilus assembly protein TadE [Dyella jiangningensis]|uniref:TadE/TadG family type IV pilus assembly protein n=1 Tax=Dyella jiangningensis TaxID=1379159 RepID=UPI0004563608|nr:TadE/TadG family type IV pilus assembly protein [Dyella jiangningensis]AHX14991.1 pilus assembly protein TadE [Dyella jiangningensis]MDG2538437.1 TadE/TadG family type IV pilus assembly protein [Dyella jiangningensis]